MLSIQVPANEVASAESRRLALPTGIPSFQLPNGHRTSSDLPVLLVRTTDHDGVCGFGLLWAQTESQLSVIEAALRFVVEMTDFGTTETLTFESLIRTAEFLGTTGPAALGAAGLVMALEDLSLQRAGTSLSEARGSRRTSVPTYQTGLLPYLSIDELEVEAARIANAGPQGVKMIVGAATVEDDVKRVAAVREVIPPTMSLMVDALQRWDQPTALRATEALGDFSLSWIEDPIRHDDLTGYAALCRHSPTPIATGELCFSPEDFGRLIDVGVRYVVCEPERIGGATRWLDLAHEVNRRGAQILPHLYPHLSAQMLATLDQPTLWLEYVPWFDQLVSSEPDFGRDGVRVSAAPGSGLSPNMDAVEHLATRPWTRLA